MDFELNDHQEALVDAIATVCAGRFPIETVRSLADVGGVDPSLWSELAATGVFGLVVAEADGGVGLGWADAVLVFEQLGRHLIPGPLVGTLLASTLRPELADGSHVVGVVDGARFGGMIEYSSALDTLLVLTDDAVQLVAMDDISVVEAPYPLDPLTPVAQTNGALPGGEIIGTAEDAARLRLAGAALSSALQLGLASGATALAVNYAKEREQFGKPIGTFQAVKHMCADMLTTVELARAAVYFAGVVLDDPEVGTADEAVAAASIVAGKAGDFCGKNCVQVHGGMGYTWEIDAHLFLKRSWVLDHAFASPDEHAELLASRL